MSNISRIESVNFSSNKVHITALIEDVVQVRPQTLFEPAEYGPALCEAIYSPDEDEVIPDTEYELIQYLEELDLFWEPIDNTDYYFD